MKRSRLALAIGATQLLLSGVGVWLAELDGQFTFTGYGLGGVTILSFTIVGTIVAWRRPEIRMGWIILAVSGLLMLSLVGVGFSVLDYRLHHGRLAAGWVGLVIEPLWLPAFAALALAILLYPEGRLPSGRWRWPLRWLGALLVAWQAATLALILHTVASGTVRVEAGGDLYQADHLDRGWKLLGLLQILLFVTLLALVVAWGAKQFTTYRRLTGARRVQQKWIISGALVAACAVVTSVLPYPFSSAANQLTIDDFTVVGLAALPVAMGVGILRYRLYEIDRIVSRTVSYVLLSAMLVGTFIGLVAVSTDLLGFSSTVGVAASTLTAAALFNPLRVRIQRRVDRRFNRARYDAEATVSEFAARLRDAVDLDAVHADLLATVERAVQPASASVWIVGGAG